MKYTFTVWEGIVIGLLVGSIVTALIMYRHPPAPTEPTVASEITLPKLFWICDENNNKIFTIWGHGFISYNSGYFDERDPAPVAFSMAEKNGVPVLFQSRDTRIKYHVCGEGK